MTRITDTSVAVCYLESIINQVQIPKFGFQIKISTIKMWIELKFLAVQPKDQSDHLWFSQLFLQTRVCMQVGKLQDKIKSLK